MNFHLIYHPKYAVEMIYLKHVFQGYYLCGLVCSVLLQMYGKQATFIIPN